MTATDEAAGTVPDTTPAAQPPAARWPRQAALAGILLAGALVPFLVGGSYLMRLIDLGLIFAIYALSLNLVLGYTGLINLGQSAFLGIGAYVSGVLTARTGLPFELSLLAAAVAGAGLGVVVGVPSLRIGGHYLALVTLGFSQIAFVLFVNLGGLTGGYDGLGGIPKPTVLGVELSNVFTFYYLPFVLLVAVGAGSAMLRASHLGRSMLAVREDEQMARALGVRIVRVKTYAFVACSAVAALAGSLYAHLYGYISPDSFTVSNSVLVLAMVLVGGLGSVWGVIAGALLLTFLPEYLRGLGDFYPVVYASVIIAVMIFFPGGLGGAVGAARRRFGGRRG